MSRPLRIQRPGDWYHVMNRGACRQPTFRNDLHRKIFIELLEEASKIFSIEIHAYCLMGNHYHLLIHTPLGNLSDAMRHINGVYTLRHNKLERRDGSLFRGRYKSIIVGGDRYLLELSRYIHLNPVRANMVRKPSDYQWSSCLEYLNSKKSSNFLHTYKIKEYFDENKWPNCYNHFLSEGDSDEIKTFFGEGKTPPYMGSEEFIEKIKLESPYRMHSKEVSDRKFLKPSIAEISKEVANKTLDASNIMEMRGISNSLVKSMIIYIARYHFGYRLEEIGQHLKHLSRSGVSSNISRFRKKLAEDHSMNEFFAEVMQSLNFIQDRAMIDE